MNHFVFGEPKTKEGNVFFAVACLPVNVVQIIFNLANTFVQNVASLR